MKTRTPFPKAAMIEKKPWYIIDAAEVSLGRLAVKIATLLMGKHVAHYVPFLDCGGYVVVINAAKVHVPVIKHEKKHYHRHSGYPGGYKSVSLARMLATHPERVIELAVRRMLPKNRLGRQLFTKLRVYADAEHRHAGQQPQIVTV